MLDILIAWVLPFLVGLLLKFMMRMDNIDAILISEIVLFLEVAIGFLNIGYLPVVLLMFSFTVYWMVKRRK